MSTPPTPKPYTVRPRADQWTREALRERGYRSLRDVAQQAGVAPSTVAKAVAGTYEPSARMIASVLHATGRPLGDWFELVPAEDD